jgi:hypothetical protein
MMGLNQFVHILGAPDFGVRAICIHLHMTEISRRPKPTNHPHQKRVLELLTDSEAKVDDYQLWRESNILYTKSHTVNLRSSHFAAINRWLTGSFLGSLTRNISVGMALLRPSNIDGKRLSRRSLASPLLQSAELPACFNRLRSEDFLRVAG